jgi:hypothetical protein
MAGYGWINIHKLIYACISRNIEEYLVVWNDIPSYPSISILIYAWIWLDMAGYGRICRHILIARYIQTYPPISSHSNGYPALSSHIQGYSGISQYIYGGIWRDIDPYHWTSIDTINTHVEGYDGIWLDMAGYAGIY